LAARPPRLTLSPYTTLFQSVLEGRDGAEPRVSVAGEIVVTGRDFYDFDAKYLDPDAAQLICPAPLGDGELREIQRIAARSFEAIDRKSTRLNSSHVKISYAV